MSEQTTGLAAEPFKGRQENVYTRMEQENLSAILLTMSDDHGSEYIAPHFQTIAYYTNFTGSAATVLFVRTKKEKGTYLWTDGRYFLQAGQELKKSGAVLMKQGEKDVPTIGAFLKKLASDVEGKALHLGLDGTLVGDAEVKALQKAFGTKTEKQLVITDTCLICNDLWEQDQTQKRPALSFEKIWELSTEYAGKSRKDKLSDIRKKMKEEGADILVLTDLDEIAWTMNLRGGDIAYHPVFYSFLILKQEDADLFVSKESLPDAFLQQEADGGINCRPYEEFYGALEELSEDERIWVDPLQASGRVMSILKNRKDLIRKTSPVCLMKAVKNETEIKNMKQAHEKDAVALTKWICYLKKAEKEFEETGKDPGLTELSVSEKLHALRRVQPGYVEDSFAPILAFAQHGAIVHYEPTPESDKRIEFGKGEYLLADTGAHFYEGTTDVTRTISLGNPSLLQKQHYTAVLKGHLALLQACFLEGAQGSSLDQLARQPLYRMGLDYRHGTGHGVGYLLSVHEGPNAFRMKPTPDNRIFAGMITSDEPGFYLEGSYGIRLESLILSVKQQTTEYGTFLGFEPLTLVCFDRESILAGELSEEELSLLNEYHKTVYEHLCDKLTEEEREWLKEQTKPLEKEGV